MSQMTNKGLLLFALAIVLTACNGISLNVSATATPDPCGIENIDAYIEEAEQISNRYDDIRDLAVSAPWTDLPPIVSDMQKIQQDAEDLETPDCPEIRAAQDALVDSLDADISVFLKFMEDADADISEELSLGNETFRILGLRVEELKSLRQAKELAD